jgi:hypothetical protein
MMTFREYLEKRDALELVEMNPAHKGWCTPMSKPTCTGKRRTFAKMAKRDWKPLKKKKDD